MRAPPCGCQLKVSDLPLDLKEGYSIHVLSFSDKADARKLREKLKTAGYPAYIDTGYLRDMGKSYRVRVGKFVHESDAVKVKAKLAREENLTDLWILPK